MAPCLVTVTLVNAVLEDNHDVYDEVGQVPISEEYVQPELFWSERRA